MPDKMTLDELYATLLAEYPIPYRGDRFIKDSDDQIRYTAMARAVEIIEANRPALLARMRGKLRFRIKEMVERGTESLRFELEIIPTADVSYIYKWLDDLSSYDEAKAAGKKLAEDLNMAAEFEEE